MELCGKYANHENAGPDKEREKNITTNTGSSAISLSWAKYWLMCFIVDVEPIPVNLTKSGSLYLGGKNIWSNHSGYGFLYETVVFLGFRPNYRWTMLVTWFIADLSEIELLVDCLVLHNHYSAFFDD